MNDLPRAVKELADADYTRLRRNLLREKGSDRQREFLESVRETSLFLDYVADLPTVGSWGVDLAPNPMTESEFKDPPSDTGSATCTRLGLTSRPRSRAVPRFGPALRLSTSRTNTFSPSTWPRTEATSRAVQSASISL